MFSARALFFSFLFSLFSFLFVATPVSAQGNPLANPQMDANVPRNQHTLVQAVTIEVLSAMMCQLSGIDIINPNTPCLGINPETRQLGYSPQSANGIQAGGLVGITTNLIASTYRPIVSTGVYTHYLSENFGIVKKVHAQTSYGFEGLKPVFNLWIAMRNISYGLLVLAFVFIGVGIMLRIKIDPRTVMSIQNQIPKVIIAIILITFSYAISALMIDLMWVSTYTGVNILASNNDVPVGDCKNKGKEESLAEKASSTILQTPLTYFNNIFARCEDESNYFVNENDRDGGFHVMTKSIGNNIGQTIGNVATSLLFDKDDLETDCKWYRPIKCVKKGAISFISTIVSAVVMIVVFVILVVTLFRIWFMLLKAYIYILVYAIVGPIFIVFGLLPSKPLGFEKWIRAMFVNVAVFPLTAFLFVGARLLMELYENYNDQFIPPLTGNPVDANFGALIAFGALLIGPSIQKILQEKMGVKGVGSPGLVAAGVTAGAAVIGAPAGRAMKHLNRRDSSNRALGGLARFKEHAGDTVLKGAKHVPIFGGAANRALDRRVKVRDRKYNESEAQVREQFNKDNPTKYRSWRNIRKNRKNGGETGGAGAGGPKEGIFSRIKNRVNRDERGSSDLFTRFGKKPKPATTSTPSVPGGVTLTGPITATGPIHGPAAKQAKQNIATEMFNKYKAKSHAAGSSINGRQEITIKQKLEETIENKSIDDVRKIEAPEWEHTIQKFHHEAEAEEKDGGGTA